MAVMVVGMSGIASAPQVTEPVYRAGSALTIGMASRRLRAEAFMFDEDDKPKKKRVHEIGQDLAALSISELQERISLLRSEIVRLEESIAAKKASEAVASTFFKT
jgi:uncharacterized small protein (DUF1192 family)